MERREKCMEKREEGIMVEKLKLVEKRGGRGRSSSSTPPPTWRLVDFPSSQQQQFLNFPTSKTLSARNLCAKLWEFHSHHHEHPPSHQPASARDSRRRVQASVVQQGKSVDRNGSALQSVAPANCLSSMEVTQDSSRELVKVLDHSWRLEEQDALNIAIVKALIMELDLSQTQVKELLQEKKMNKQEIESLMKKITEDKLVNQNKEHEKIKAVVQSVKEEIEDERKLRKHSESLYQKLASELYEVKSLLRGTLRDLEGEKKQRILLENLCDDFAKGVRDYEHELRSIMHNSADKDHIKGDSLDRLILHISEAWLDERTQMKLVQDGIGSDLLETHSIVDKLHVDIETFLHTKRSIDLKRYNFPSIKEVKEIHPCLPSLDSFQLKETINSPHNFVEEASIGTNKFKQKRTAENRLNKCFVEGKSSEIGRYSRNLLNAPRETTLCETVQGPPENDRCRTKRINSCHSLEQLVGNSSLSSEGDKVYPESICREDACVHSAVTVKGSPVKQWKKTLFVPDFDKSQSTNKLPRGVKDNTFMAKLLEARLEDHKSRSKPSKSSF